jgi:hypothetical protein
MDEEETILPGIEVREQQDPRLSCCDAGARMLRLAFEDYYVEDKDHFKKEKPWWVVKGASHEKDTFNFMPISSCPFCGMGLPDVQLKAVADPRTFTLADGGDYCATCGERLRSCNCLNPESLWEIIPGRPYSRGLPKLSEVDLKHLLRVKELADEIFSDGGHIFLDTERCSTSIRDEIALLRVLRDEVNKGQASIKIIRHPLVEGEE